MCDKLVDDRKRDIASQKAFADKEYYREESLICFVGDLKIEILTKEMWKELLFIKSKSGVINLLDNHTVIIEKEILF